jgi:hypothetical protein
MPFSKLFKHHQLIPALHPIRNNEFWQQIYAQQLKDYWQQPRHVGNEEAWKKTHFHVHSGPKRTQGVAPTA